MSGEEILEIVRDEARRSMERALTACGQSAALYRNAMGRVAEAPGLTPDERAEAGMVLFVAAGCTADARRAATAALDFARTVHGGGAVTPAPGTHAASSRPATAGPGAGSEPVLGLLRLVDGHAVGSPFWLSPAAAGTVVGALATEEGAVNDVGATVSGRHLRLWHDEDGRWLAEGLGSRNGTVLARACDGAHTVVEPPQSARSAGDAPAPVGVRPGDRLILGEETVFLVLEGYPEA